MISHKTTWVLAVFLLLVGALTVRASEEDDLNGGKVDDYVKNRVYIGILGTSSVLDQWNSFNGVHYLSNGTPSSGNPVIDWIPSITRQFGWGCLLGYREGPWAAELSFCRSDHTATFIDSTPVTYTTPASLQSINFDLKRYFLTKLPAQPYINLGISFPWLWVRQFSYLTDSNIPPAILETEDETFSGIGLNLGAGLEFYFEKDFSLFAGAAQRWSEFDQVNGADKNPTSMSDLTLDGTATKLGSLSGNGLSFYLGGTLVIE
jgi:hypothetical protein